MAYLVSRLIKSYVAGPEQDSSLHMEKKTMLMFKHFKIQPLPVLLDAVSAAPLTLDFTGTLKTRTPLDHSIFTILIKKYKKG